MPNWKKVITSGSNANLNSLIVNTNISSSDVTGSFNGDGFNITNLNYNNISNPPSIPNVNNNTITINGGTGLNVSSNNNFTLNQSSNQTITLSIDNSVATQTWVNNQGFITGYSETDTLQSVTNRGNNTNEDIIINTNNSNSNGFFRKVIYPPGSTGGWRRKVLSIIGGDNYNVGGIAIRGASDQPYFPSITGDLDSDDGLGWNTNNAFKIGFGPSQSAFIGSKTLNVENGVYHDGDLLAKNNNVVKLIGNQNVNGVKTFEEIELKDRASTGNKWSFIEAGDDGRLLIRQGGNFHTQITENGDFGIGVNPTQKLEVNGNIKANSFIKTGGSSTEFLKADGSVDTNNYLTGYSETDTLQSVTDRGNTTNKNVYIRDLITSRDGIIELKTLADDSFGGVIGTTTDHDLTFTRNNNSKIKLTNNGTEIDNGKGRFWLASSLQSPTGTSIYIPLSNEFNYWEKRGNTVNITSNNITYSNVDFLYTPHTPGNNTSIFETTTTGSGSITITFTGPSDRNFDTWSDGGKRIFYVLHRSGDRPDGIHIEYLHEDDAGTNNWQDVVNDTNPEYGQNIWSFDASGISLPHVNSYRITFTYNNTIQSGSGSRISCFGLFHPNMPFGYEALGFYGKENKWFEDNFFDKKVGIGTTNPDYQLTVNGKINLNDGGKSVFIGEQAGLNDDASNNRNVGIGYQALLDNTTGKRNTATGTYALLDNTTGDDNTAVGYQSLLRNTTGERNTATGYRALQENTTGKRNTATGFYALQSNTTGERNIATGYYALQRNTIGNNNIATGYQALRYNTTGERNIATGYYAGRTDSSGTGITNPNDSIFLGYNTKALSDNGVNEIVIGSNVTGLGSNTIVLGNDNINTTALKGNVGIGTLSPSEALEIDGNIKLSETSATTDTNKFVVLDNGVIKYRTGGQILSDIGAQPAGNYDNYSAWRLKVNGQFRQGVNSGDSVDFVGGNNINLSYSNNSVTIGADIGIDGTGTNNYIPKFSNSTTLTNSNIYEYSNKIGIGTTTPEAALHISGDINNNQNSDGITLGTNTQTQSASINLKVGSSSSGSSDINFGWPNNNYSGKISYNNRDKEMSFYTNLKERIIIDGSGGVGINLSNPSEALEVNGNIKADSFIESSLQKLKENISPYKERALEKINNLNIVNFDKKDGAKNKIGIIADDKTTDKDFLNEKKDSVDLYKTLFIQAKAIKELNTKVEKQDKEIEELKKLVNKLTDNG